MAKTVVITKKDVEKAIELINEVCPVELKDALEKVLNYAQSEAADIKAKAEEEAEQIRKKAGTQTIVRPKPKLNPDYEMSEDGYKEKDKVKVKFTATAEYHKPGSEDIVTGHQAEIFIKKGAAIFVEVVEKWKPPVLGKSTVVGK